MTPQNRKNKVAVGVTEQFDAPLNIFVAYSTVSMYIITWKSIISVRALKVSSSVAQINVFVIFVSLQYTNFVYKRTPPVIWEHRETSIDF